MKRLLALGALLSGILFLSPVLGLAPVYAQDEEPTAEASPEAGGETEEAETEEAPAEEEDPYAAIPMDTQIWYGIGNVILFVCAVLVLFMQAGFAMVESGFNASKNTVNILFKNVMDLCLGALLFWAIGYNIMYPGAWGDGNPNGYFAMPDSIGRPEVQDAEGLSGTSLSPQSDFLFQVAFAATAATIVSGAVAGRMKFGAYLIYSMILTAIVYPISGSWKWGYGWLDAKGFHDFAGSLIVHAVGGFAGLAGAIVLGPRIGKFSEDGKPQAMPGHNLTIAALGVFILWVGWYGFNPGSVLTFEGVANINLTMLVAVNTTLAAAAGGLLGMATSWGMFGKPDLSMALNGCLAGLVGITANADVVTNPESIIIGAVAGVLVVLGVVLLDKVKIDDPVGAWPVHGLCGIWGGIATGIFGEGKDLGVQILGSVAYAVWAFVTMLVIFLVLKTIGLLRVSPEEEMQGLDLCEHGMHAYEQPN